jgi:hypothetical protein
LILLLPIVAIDKSDMVFLDLGYKNWEYNEDEVPYLLNVIDPFLYNP